MDTYGRQSILAHVSNWLKFARTNALYFSCVLRSHNKDCRRGKFAINKGWLKPKVLTWTPYMGTMSVKLPKAIMAHEHGTFLVLYLWCTLALVIHPIIVRGAWVNHIYFN